MSARPDAEKVLKYEHSGNLQVKDLNPTEYALYLSGHNFTDAELNEIISRKYYGPASSRRVAQRQPESFPPPRQTRPRTGAWGSSSTDPLGGSPTLPSGLPHHSEGRRAVDAHTQRIPRPLGEDFKLSRRKMDEVMRVLNDDELKEFGLEMQAQSSRPMGPQVEGSKKEFDDEDYNYVLALQQQAVELGEEPEDLLGSDLTDDPLGTSSSPPTASFASLQHGGRFTLREQNSFSDLVPANPSAASGLESSTTPRHSVIFTQSGLQRTDGTPQGSDNFAELDNVPTSTDVNELPSGTRRYTMGGQFSALYPTQTPAPRRRAPLTSAGAVSDHLPTSRGTTLVPFKSLANLFT